MAPLSARSSTAAAPMTGGGPAPYISATVGVQAKVMIEVHGKVTAKVRAKVEVEVMIQVHVKVSLSTEHFVEI
jgi:hypothetical protein